MSFARGEIVLAYFPLAAGGPPKKRPVLIVQSDAYNVRLQNRIVALITSTLAHAGDPASVLVEIATPDGKTSGLLRDSVISCINLAPIHESLIDRKIGTLSPILSPLVDAAIKSALELP